MVATPAGGEFNLEEVDRVPKTRKPAKGSPKRHTAVTVGLTILALLLIGGGVWYNRAQAAPRQFTITTGRGDIVVEVYPALMPVTVANFQRLVGARFFDGLTFHRVEDWVVQGGDPEGDGTGGPGWTIPLETHPELRNVRGALAMARAMHPDSAGSQFYILRQDAPGLDGQYAVFGRVISGMEVVDQLVAGDIKQTVRRTRSGRQ
jgi:peptidyl-prolyl cis-trans isomerase B (cyclophilin B)